MTSPTVTSVDVSILHVRECPSVDVLVKHLGAASELSGVRLTISFRLVDSEADAQALDFGGSPTVWIDGHDPFDNEGPSLSCRLYRSGSGVLGAPSVSQLTAALLVASAGRDRMTS